MNSQLKSADVEEKGGWEALGTEMTFPTALSEQHWLSKRIERRPHPRREERSAAERVGWGREPS